MVKSVQTVLRKLGQRLGLVSAIAIAPIVLGILPAKAVTVDGVITENEYLSERSPVLRLGVGGPEVRDLQLFLQQQGFYTDEVDGYFGPNTLNAVQNFQAANSLVADGIVGRQTWSALADLADSKILESEGVYGDQGVFNPNAGPFVEPGDVEGPFIKAD